MKSIQNRSLSIESSLFVKSAASHIPISIPFHLSIRRTPYSPKNFPFLFTNQRARCVEAKAPSFFSEIYLPYHRNFFKIKLFNAKIPSLFDLSATHLPLMAVVSVPLPCFAAGTDVVESSKINIESVLVSIDDFFNRYPYFVASLAFVWLVAIPLTKEYLSKCKYISSIDAFRKVRDEPTSQLLDIRKKQSVAYLKTPNLKIVNKVAVNLEYVEGCEEEFIKEVLKSFRDPGNTILCVLDNFDGNSLKVAKLLFENGFKEAYSIKGGLLGNNGWQAIQETLLPPSVRVYPKMKSRNSPDQDDDSRERIEEHDENMQLLTSSSINQEVIQNIENGYIKSGSSPPTAQDKHGRPLSPYPNFLIIHHSSKQTAFIPVNTFPKIYESSSSSSPNNSTKAIWELTI